ncbi:hypothetical protein [Echinimonas agarilytica]|uniref:Uncharacterized protein n=1 Tax=Echinimonas agarilytica TaxID=1215918 RepID=A0AA42B6C9_9GAMM|nr:hypothetical protein [Echinimonas agarilytica]MCM2678296.1 hypothetical protein [Echinimonas agarilytica]
MSIENTVSETNTSPVKAELAWAYKLVSQGNPLPRGKAFSAYVGLSSTELLGLIEGTAAPAKAPIKRAKSAAKVTAEKKNVEKVIPSADLTEAQATALAALQEVGDWSSAKAIKARKATLDALVKKGVAQSRTLEDESVEYKV